MLSSAEIILFWASIMRDHAEFHLLELSSRETEYINTAHFYKNAFESIRKEAEELLNCEDDQSVKNLANKVYPLLVNFINFKRIVIRKLLLCDIELGLTPTFINHMINEACEFYRDLCKIQSKFKMDPTFENILLHKIWLPDASGHAAAIASDLDPTETLLIKKANDFKKTFDNLFIKAIELGQMLERTCLKDNALEWLNKEVEEKINEFICFIEKVKSLRMQCKILGTIKPLIPDHMIREEKYYLANIKKVLLY